MRQRLSRAQPIEAAIVVGAQQGHDRIRLEGPCGEPFGMPLCGEVAQRKPLPGVLRAQGRSWQARGWRRFQIAMDPVAVLGRPVRVAAVAPLGLGGQPQQTGRRHP
ncbi:hypothetical protein [Streptomyces sp. AK04-3B]|uniref:hypothetical protein n=1 Tax=Streptomyces sp. AK04-3B TaxID=3028650 RepID=UPI0029C0337F|nr:hypothetical protein [Streptomyces sp. AK04-3B]